MANSSIKRAFELNWQQTNSKINTKADANHTHNYAGASSAGGAATSANKVNTNLAIKLNSGSTEGTNLFTFNGSTAKTINITPANIGAATDTHKHAATDITSGTLSADRLPTVPITKGGTGATTAAAARTNLSVYSKAEVDSAISSAMTVDTTFAV